MFRNCDEFELKAAWLGGSLFMYLTLPVRLPVAVIVYVTWWPAGSAWEVAGVAIIAAAAAKVAAAIPVVAIRTFVISQTLPNPLPPYPGNGLYHAGRSPSGRAAAV
ncbi:hypothetical protein MINTM019_34290 [Mycobacterium paraintracellulare]|nr:hypothetical protein MINTM019_34290 [Mycobacterium paraintracellulare]